MRLSPDGGATPAPRRDGRPRRDAQPPTTAGSYFDGDDRHPDDRLAALPRGRARHAQQPPVVRLAPADARPRRRRLKPGDLVHRRPPGARSSTRPRGARGDGPVDGEHPRATRAGRGAATSRPADGPLLHDARALEIAARRGRRGTASSTTRPAGACTQALPAPLDVAHRGRRPARGRRLQVRACSRSTDAIAEGAVRDWKPTAARSRAWSRSSRPGCATTRSRTSAGRRALAPSTW